MLRKLCHCQIKVLNKLLEVELLLPFDRSVKSRSIDRKEMIHCLLLILMRERNQLRELHRNTMMREEDEEE